MPLEVFNGSEAAKERWEAGVDSKRGRLDVVKLVEMKLRGVDDE